MIDSCVMTWTKQPRLLATAQGVGQLLNTLLRIQALDKLAKARRLLETQGPAKGNTDALEEPGADAPTRS